MNNIFYELNAEAKKFELLNDFINFISQFASTQISNNIELTIIDNLYFYDIHFNKNRNITTMHNRSVITPKFGWSTIATQLFKQTH